jgi:hypothetical protein
MTAMQMLVSSNTLMHPALGPEASRLARGRANAGSATRISSKKPRWPRFAILPLRRLHEHDNAALLRDPKWNRAVQREMRGVRDDRGGFESVHAGTLGVGPASRNALHALPLRIESHAGPTLHCVAGSQSLGALRRAYKSSIASNSARLNRDARRRSSDYWKAAPA